MSTISSVTLDPRIEILRPSECAERLGSWATPSYVRRLAAKGVLPSVRLGRSIRILVTSDESAANIAFHLPLNVRLLAMQDLAPRLGLTYRALRWRVWDGSLFSEATRRIGGRVLLAVDQPVIVPASAA